MNALNPSALCPCKCRGCRYQSRRLACAWLCCELLTVLSLVGHLKCPHQRPRTGFVELLVRVTIVLEFYPALWPCTPVSWPKDSRVPYRGWEPRIDTRAAPVLVNFGVVDPSPNGERVRNCSGFEDGQSLRALIPNIGRDPPSQNTRAEALDTRSSGSCRGRVVANTCLGWSYG